jgi:hypothetical protein
LLVQLHVVRFSEADLHPEAGIGAGIVPGPELVGSVEGIAPATL